MTNASAPSEDLPRRSRQLQATLDELGLPGRIRELPGSTRTAKDAAAAVGCEVGAIASSLVFTADGAPVLVMTSGRHRVDPATLSTALGAAEVAMASPDMVREATGMAIGGVAPLGHPAPLRTLVDEALGDHEELWAAGGTPRTVFPLTFEDLVRVTQGEVARVSLD